MLFHDISCMEGTYLVGACMDMIFPQYCMPRTQLINILSYIIYTMLYHEVVPPLELSPFHCCYTD